MVVVATMPPLTTGAAARANSLPIRGMATTQPRMAAPMPTVAQRTVRHSFFNVAMSTDVPMLNSRKYWPSLATPAKPEISMMFEGYAPVMNNTKKPIMMTNMDEIFALVKAPTRSPTKKMSNTANTA